MCKPQELYPATTLSRAEGETTDPVDADHPPPSFPNFTIWRKKTCSEKYRRHYTNDQHWRLIT